MAQIDESSDYYNASPALAFALLFYPLIDTLRIFFIRIFVLKKSPFKADKNHIHHRFIHHGFSHIKTTVTIVLINFVIIVIAFNLLEFKLNNQIISLILYGSALYYLPFVVNKLMNK